MTVNTITRQEIINSLRERDGVQCQYPGCLGSLDFSVADGPLEVTIDHWIPQWWGKENGWTHDQIWALSNLKLMHKKCNAKKAERVPLEDGTLPERVVKDFRYRRQKRAERPDICVSCNAGRNLSDNEWCNACGSGPQPERFPKWRQMQPKECDHDLFFCVACTVWFPEKRRSVLDSLVTGGKGYE